MSTVNLTENETIMVSEMVVALTRWGDKLRNGEFADDAAAGKELAHVCVNIVQLVRMCDLIDGHVPSTA